VTGAAATAITATVDDMSLTSLTSLTTTTTSKQCNCILKPTVHLKLCFSSGLKRSLFAHLMQVKLKFIYTVCMMGSVMGFVVNLPGFPAVKKFRKFVKN